MTVTVTIVQGGGTPWGVILLVAVLGVLAVAAFIRVGIQIKLFSRLRALFSATSGRAFSRARARLRVA